MSNDNIITRRAKRTLLYALAVVSTLGLQTAFVATAMAGGLEWPGLGTRGAGRAGAWRAHADTALALHVNPANLARLSATQLELTLNLGTLDACFDRTGTPTQDSDGNSRVPMTPTPNDTVFGTQAEYGDVEYPRLCNNRGFFPLPQLALSTRLHERVGLGFGLVAPNAPTGGSSYGDAEGTMPAPSRPPGDSRTPRATTSCAPTCCSCSRPPASASRCTPGCASARRSGGASRASSTRP